MNIIENDGTKFGFKTANGSLTGTLKTLQQRTSDLGFTGYFIKDYNTRDVDFTSGVYSDSLCVVVKKAERIPQFLLPLIIFQDTLWFTLFAMTLMSFCFWCCLRMIHNKRMPNVQTKIIKFNVPSHLIHQKPRIYQYIQLFIDTWMLLLLSPMIHLTRVQSERILVGSISLLGVIFVSMFQSGLANVYTKPMYHKNILNLQQLEETGLNILIKYQTMLADLFPSDSSELFKTLHKRMTLIEKPELTALKVTSTMNMATVTRKLNFGLSNETNFVHLIPECPRVYNLAYLMSRHSIYAERVNEILLDIQCYGFIKKWITDMHFNNTLIKLKDNQMHDDKVLTIYDLLLPFLILLFGIIVGFVVLLFEKIFKPTKVV